MSHFAPPRPRALLLLFAAAAAACTPPRPLPPGETPPPADRRGRSGEPQSEGQRPRFLPGTSISWTSAEPGSTSSSPSKTDTPLSARFEAVETAACQHRLDGAVVAGGRLVVASAEHAVSRLHHYALDGTGGEEPPDQLAQEPYSERTLDPPLERALASSIKRAGA